MFKFRKSILFIGILIVAAASSLATVAALFATGSIVADPVELVFTVEDITKTYDGTPLYANGYTLESGELKQGHSVSVEYTGSQTAVGVGESSMTVRVWEGSNDVSSQYTIAINPGTLTVEKCAIKLKVDDIKRVYGDEVLEVTENNCSFIEGRFAVGHKLQSFSLKMTGTGTFNNDEIEPHVFDANSIEVTENYDIDLEIGTIEVVKRPIIIKPKDVSVVFDNQPHTATEYEVVTSEDTYNLVAGHKVTFVINEGESENYSLTSVDKISTELTSVSIFDGANNDVTSNYDIIKQPGTLEVTKCPISVTAKSKSWVYDGEPHRMTSEDGVFQVTGLPKNDSVQSVEYSTDEILNEGEIPSSIVAIILQSSSDNYEITYFTGTMTVTKRPLTVTTPKMTFDYDGLEHAGVNMDGDKDETLSYSPDPGLVEGHTVELVSVAVRTAVGTSRNDVEIDIVDVEGNSVKANYQINYVFDTLTINARELTVRTRDMRKPFDGTIAYGVRKDADGNFLTIDDAGKVSPAVSGDMSVSGIVARGQSITVSNVAAVYGIGTKRNSLEIRVVGKDGADVTQNYLISYDYGTLTVDMVAVNVITENVTVTYDGVRKYGVEPVYEGENIVGYKNATMSGAPVDGEGKALFMLFVPDENRPYLNGVGSRHNIFDYRVYAKSVVEVTDPDYALDEKISVDQTENFQRGMTSGTLTVNKRTLTISTENLTKAYDGNALTDTKGIWDNGNLVGRYQSGSYSYQHALVADTEAAAEITDVGSVPNKYEYDIVLKGIDNDTVSATFREFDASVHNYKECYEISENFGTLTVERRKVTVYTEDYVAFYNGTVQSNPNLKSYRTDKPSEFGFVEGEYEVNAEVAIARADAMSSAVSNRLLYDLRRAVSEDEYEDTSGNYEITEQWGSFLILPLYIRVSTASNTAVYGSTGDGLTGALTIEFDKFKMLDAYRLIPGNELATNFPSAGKEADKDLDKKLLAVVMAEEKISAKLPAIHFVGESCQNKADLKFEREEGKGAEKVSVDSTYSYVIVSESYGTLTVTPKPLTVEVKSNTKPYDGTPLEAVRTVEGDAKYELVAGDEEYGVEAAGITDFGEVTGSYTFSVHRKVGEGEEASYVDTTDCYTIKEVFGKLSITKKQVKVRTDNIDVVYDGLNHVPELECEDGFEFVEGELKAGVATRSFVNVCTYQSVSFTYTLGREEDGGSVNTASNYSIDESGLGTVTIWPRTIVITTPSLSREYNGESLSSTDKTSGISDNSYMIESVYDNDSAITYTPTSSDPFALNYLTKSADQVHSEFKLTPVRALPSITNVGSVSNEITFRVDYTEKSGDKSTLRQGNANFVLEYATGSTLEITPLTATVYSKSKTDIGFNNEEHSLLELETVAAGSAELKGEGLKKLKDLGLSVAPDATKPYTKVKYVSDGVQPNVFGLQVVGATDQSNFDITLVPGSLKVVRREVTLKTDGYTGYYDGEEHYYANLDADKPGYTLGKSSDNFEEMGIDVEIVSYATITYAGSVKNTITFSFTDKNTGKSLNDDVWVKDGTIGVIKIEKRPVVVVTANVPEREYDGTAMMNEEDPDIFYGTSADSYETDVSVKKGLVGDDVLISFTALTSITNAGTAENKVIVNITNQSSYSIKYKYGTLKIKAKTITVTTFDAGFEYDGLPHSCPEYSSDGLVGSDTLTVTTAPSFTTVAQTETGNNKLKFRSVNYIVDEDNSTYGTITITPRNVTVVTGSYEGYYDGNSHSVGTFEVIGAIQGDIFTIAAGTTLTPVIDATLAPVDNEFALAPNANYQYNYNYGTLQVKPLPVTATSKTVNRVYNGQALANNEYQGIAYSSDLLKNAVSAPTYTTSTTNRNKNVKTGVENSFDLTLADGMDVNFVITKVYGTITITPAPATVRLKEITKVYNGNNYFGTAGVLKADFVEVSGMMAADGYNADGWLYWADGQDWTKAGEYSITITKHSAQSQAWQNYNLSIAGTARLIIEKCAVTVTTGSATYTYDGTAKSCDSVYTNLPAGFGYRIVTTTDPVSPPTITDSGTITNAFRVDITKMGVAGNVTENFEITYHYGTITVNPVNVTVSAKDKTKEYDGNPFTFSADDFIYSDESVKNLFTPTPDSSLSNFKNAGSTPFTFTVTPKNGASLDNYSVTLTPATLTITKKKITLTSPSDTVIYDGEDHFPKDTSKITGDALPAGATKSYDYGTAKAIDVGVYEVAFKVDGLNENYELVKNVGSIIITPAAVSVLVRDYSYVYDGQDHYLDPQTAVEDAIYEISGATIAKTEFILTGEATERGSVNEIKTYYYRAEIKDATAVKNYTLNYNIGSVQIMQYSVTVSSMSATKAYDGTALTERSKQEEVMGKFKITYTYSDDATITDVGSVENDFDVKVEIIKDGVPVDITAQTLITKVVGTLTITKGQLRVASKSVYITYTGTKYTGTFETEYSASAPVSEVKVTKFGTMSDDDLTKAGVKQITFSPDDVTVTVTDESGNAKNIKDNFIITCEFGYLNIAKKSATYITPSRVYTYDGSEHRSNPYDSILAEKVKNTGKLTGLCAGHSLDSESAPLGEQFRSVTYVTDSAINERRVTIKDASGKDVTENYELSYNFGMLTVQPKPITLRTKSATQVYNGKDLEARSFETNTDIATGETVTPEGAAVKQKDVGSKANAFTAKIMSGTTDRTANYSITYMYGTLTVTHAPMTVTTGSYSWVYDNSAHDGSLASVGVEEAAWNAANYIDGAVNGEEVLFSGDWVTITDVGSKRNEVPVIANGCALTNYDITYNYGTLTVTPYEIEILLRNFESEYLGADATATDYDIIVSRAILNAEETLFGLTKANFEFSGAVAITGVGTVPYSVKLRDDVANAGNYNLKIGTGIIVITKKFVTVTLAKYNDALNPINYRKGGYTLTTGATNLTSGAISVFDANSIGEYDPFVKAELTADKFVCPSLNMNAASSYSYTVTVQDSAVLRNFDLNIVPGIVVIKPLGIKVQATVKDINYSGEEVTLELGADANAGAGIVALEITEIATASPADLSLSDFVLVGDNTFKDAGRYPFSVQFADPLNNNNYVLTLSGCTFRINKLDVAVNYGGSTSSVFNGNYFVFDDDSFTLNTTLAAASDWTVYATFTQSKFSYKARLAACTVLNEEDEDITANLNLSGAVDIERTKLTVNITLAEITSSTQNVWLYDGVSADKYIEISSGLVTLKGPTYLTMSIDYDDEGNPVYRVTGLDNTNLFDFGGLTDAQINKYLNVVISETGSFNII